MALFYGRDPRVLQVLGGFGLIDTVGARQVFGGFGLIYPLVAFSAGVPGLTLQFSAGVHAGPA